MSLRPLLLTIALLAGFSLSSSGQGPLRAEYSVKGRYELSPDSLPSARPTLMVLEVMEGNWFFYHHGQMVSDSVVQAIMTTDGDMIKALNAASQIDTSGLNLYVRSDINRGHRTVTHIISHDYYLYDEAMARPRWSIDTSITERHAGYPCHRATAKYLGREWTVWYTPEIPMQAGPWKLWGLPGLIVKATEKEGRFAFTLTSLHPLTPQQSKASFTPQHTLGEVLKESKVKVHNLLKLSITDFVQYLQLRFPEAQLTPEEGEEESAPSTRPQFIPLEQ